MNVFDFDDTIYDGDSSVDFFKFCCKKNCETLKILPFFGVNVFLYLLKLRTKEQMKSSYFGFVRYIENIDETVESFWKTHQYKIKEFYKRKHCDDDLVISASPDFLLEPICRQLNVRLIATRVDPKTGQLLGKNCRGKEKVRRFCEYTSEEIDEFYSDSLSDSPLRDKAKKAFLVKGNRLLDWEEK